MRHASRHVSHRSAGIVIHLLYHLKQYIIHIAYLQIQINITISDHFCNNKNQTRNTKIRYNTLDGIELNSLPNNARVYTAHSIQNQIDDESVFQINMSTKLVGCNSVNEVLVTTNA